MSTRVCGLAGDAMPSERDLCVSSGPGDVPYLSDAICCAGEVMGYARGLMMSVERKL